MTNFPIRRKNVRTRIRTRDLLAGAPNALLYEISRTNLVDPVHTTKVNAYSIWSHN